MTAPVGAHVGKVFESMGDAVVEFLFDWIRLVDQLSDAVGHHLGITLLMTCIVAARTLHTSSVFQQLAALSTAHDAIKLLLYELVSALLHNILFPLMNSSFSAQNKVKWLLVPRVLGEGHGKVDSAYWFK